MDNKKRLQEGAIVFGLFAWAIALIVVLAGILNMGEGFRIVCVLLLAGVNVYFMARVVKYIKENFNSLY